MVIERLAVYAVRCGQTVQRKAVTSGKYLLKESKNKLLNDTKIGRGLKGCVNTAKAAVEIIKQYKSACDPKVLELKRIEAKNYVSSISEDTWKKMSKQIFVQPGESGSELLDYLKAVKEYCIKHEVKMGDEVQTALNRLEHKAAVFAERMNAVLAEGKIPQKFWTYGKKFRKNNLSDFTKLETFLKQEYSALDNKIRNSLDHEDWKKAMDVQNELLGLRGTLRILDHLSLYNDKIGEVSDKIIHKGQIVFHGTKKQNTIAKNGFHLIPKAGQAAIAPRELGQGVYLTPDKRVASTFAGLRGGILKLKADTKKVAVVNDIQRANLSLVLSRTLGSYNLTPARHELLVSELFKRNGYNAVYAREALGKNCILGSFNQELVDKLAGGKQSQLVVFNPEDITVLNKSFKEKISNQALQIKTKLSIPLKIIQAIREEMKA